MTDIQARLAAALADRYRIARALGAGGMATVYLAEDLKHDRKVAIKVLKPELAAVLGAERFVQEIKTTAALSHPHILPLFDSGEADGFLYYVMPYIEGETIRDRLNRENQLGVDEAVRITCEIADALDYAHRHGVIHRDIKPENLLLHDGRAMVMDFGIALAVSAAAGGRMTETGLSLGTPHYMSPEQATADRDITARSDIYSLASVCYEMLTGNPPHVGSSAQQVIMKIITEQPQEVTTHRKSVPANVAAAVGKALEKLPADRFESAAKFAEALESPSFTVGASGAQAVAVVSDLRRLRVVAIGASAVAVLALILAGWFAMRGPAGAADVALITLLPPEGESFSARSSFGALSPDGRKFAFVTLSARGERRIWIRSLDSLESVAIEGTSGAEAPFWSPDGKSLAFFVGDRLNRLELGTAVSRALCAAPSADAGSWGDDGTIVFTTVRGVERVHADGGPCTVAIPSDSGGRFRHPSLFAGGKKVLFEFRGGPLLNQEVRVGDLESGQQTLLLERGISPSWIAPGYIVYGLIGRDGASGIYAQRLSRNGEAVRGEAVALTGSVRTSNNIFAYSASASGALVFLPGFGDREKLLVSRSGEIVDTVRQRGAWTHRFAHTRPLVALNGSSALWAYDIGAGVSTALARDQTPLNSAYPVWAPGDTALVSGYGALQMISVGSRDVQPLSIPQSAGIHATDWSSDGRLLILEDAEGLATYDFASGRITRIAGLANATEGVLSPDMRWISYVSQETGAPEVFVAPWGRGGSTTRVSRASGRTPRWRGDGRELFFVTAEGGVTSVPFSVGGAPTLNADALRQTLLFRAPGWSRPFHADIGHFYDASPDGQRFVLRTSASASYAVLMKNWPTMMGIR